MEPIEDRKVVLQQDVVAAADSKASRKASRDALKAVYFVVVGLAVREALNRTFLSSSGSFLGVAELFAEKHLSTTLLFCGFLPTVVRFVHGASIHVDALSEKRFKPLVDFAGFIVQGALFYLMAVTLTAPTDFARLFCAMLLFDTGWLWLLHVTRYHRMDATERQWVVSNFLLAGLQFAILLHSGGLSIGGVGCLLAAATTATILDYYSNRDFYFPDGSPNGSTSPPWIPCSSRGIEFPFCESSPSGVRTPVVLVDSDDRCL